ncbi:hypothetical protein IP69_13760 [Bosea sp. AAP35]|nr:hypothetical protein IP69_13760 [Bosea sp. AAP35]
MAHAAPISVLPAKRRWLGPLSLSAALRTKRILPLRVRVAIAPAKPPFSSRLKVPIVAMMVSCFYGRAATTASSIAVEVPGRPDAHP